MHWEHGPSERGAIRKGCDAFKLGDGFGSEYKLHTGSLSILIVEESREGRVGQSLSEPRTGSSELWKKITQTQTGEVQTTIRPFISRSTTVVSDCTFSNLANLELELELYDTAYPKSVITTTLASGAVFLKFILSLKIYQRDRVSSHPIHSRRMFLELSCAEKTKVLKDILILSSLRPQLKLSTSAIQSLSKKEPKIGSQ